MNCLNRMDYFSWLLSAYNKTGNPIYTRYFDATAIDWVLHNPCPNALSGGAPCSPQGVATHPQCAWGAADAPGAQACATGTFESPWRSLEMGIRTNGVFAAAFFGFQRAAEFSTSARVLLVLAMAEHNAALSVDDGHPGQGTPNWELGQWSGLVTSTVTFPELANAAALQRQALAQLEAVFASVVYPDGVETEMASGYDMWTAAESLAVLHTLARGGAPPPPPSYAAHVEEMWNYGSYIVDPELCLPRNGDSDLCGGGYSADAAAYFDRPDWTYIATRGAAGTPPASPSGPSSVFPWAGQLALRSGFARSDTWVFFDVGPYGSSVHAHRDKLHLNLHARGSMLLVDSGRFAYAGSDLSNTLHTQYGPYAFAHNTLTLDGADQLPKPPTADAPIPSASFSLSPAADWAYGAMAYWNASLRGNATHTRGVYYQRPPSPGAEGDFLLVADLVTGDRARAVEATWHAHPNATGCAIGPAPGYAGVVGGADTRSGCATGAQACIVPATGALAGAWGSARVVRGVLKGAAPGQHYQGWYSQDYDDAWPADVLVYSAAAVPSGSVFVWLIVPQGARGACSDAAEVLSVGAAGVAVRATVGGVAHEVTVPLG